jgi:hypothetical protein
MKTRIFTTVMMVFFAVSMLCGTTSAKGKEFKIISNLEMAADPMIKIDNWMVNNIIWNRASEFNLAADRDEILVIEPWMTNQGLWEKSEVVDEKELTIEGWMVDENVWDTSSFELKIEKDRALDLEAWMTDNTNWK